MGRGSCSSARTKKWEQREADLAKGPESGPTVSLPSTLWTSGEIKASRPSATPHPKKRKKKKEILRGNDMWQNENVLHDALPTKNPGGRKLPPGLTV